MTEKERKVVLAVFGELHGRPYDELNRFLSSTTIDEMTDLYWRLKLQPYCKRFHVKYEKMTEAEILYAQEEMDYEESKRRWGEPEEEYDCEADYISC